jgi:hypothetical protein
VSHEPGAQPCVPRKGRVQTHHMQGHTHSRHSTQTDTDGAAIGGDNNGQQKGDNGATDEGQRSENKPKPPPISQPLASPCAHVVAPIGACQCSHECTEAHTQEGRGEEAARLHPLALPCLSTHTGSSNCSALGQGRKTQMSVQPRMHRGAHARGKGGRSSAFAAPCVSCPVCLSTHRQQQLLGDRHECTETDAHARRKRGSCAFAAPCVNCPVCPSTPTQSAGPHNTNDWQQQGRCLSDNKHPLPRVYSFTTQRNKQQQH